jgi:glyoxylase-like metal-dependent hydrolase (beta-lactamase superfamily II)
LGKDIKKYMHKSTTIQVFTCNAFQENTYLVHHEKTAWLFDPGCVTQSEQAKILQYIQEHHLQVEKICITHSHIDHVLGLAWTCETFGIAPSVHALDMPTLLQVPNYAPMYGFQVALPNLDQAEILQTGQILQLQDIAFEVRFVPGHAPGHVAFVNHAEKYIISGDVLFKNSIGRTDLPGSDPDLLLTSIRTQLYSLADDFVVYAGHGTPTNIGKEKNNNPFVRA